MAINEPADNADCPVLPNQLGVEEVFRIRRTMNEVYNFVLLAVVTSAGSAARIADGEATTLGEYPSIVSLGLSSWSNIYHVHYCAGSILTESWVVTVASCIEDAVDDVGRYYWLAGTNNLRSGGTQHAISQIHLHPGFNSTASLLHNIALVKVKSPFEFSATIQPIDLDPDFIEKIGPDTPGVVVGWGQVSQTLIQPDVNRKIDVTIIDTTTCQDIYSQWAVTIEKDYEFCTSSSSMQRDVVTIPQFRGACRGDEGGPLIQSNTKFPYFLGFVSWTYGCGGTTEYPSVHVKISAYLDWITERTGYWI